MVKLSSCLQLATSLGNYYAMSALKAATCQAQPTRAMTHIACTSKAVKSMRRKTTIATTVVRCARCAWLQNDETSAIAHGDGMQGQSYAIPTSSSSSPA